MQSSLRPRQHHTRRLPQPRTHQPTRNQPTIHRMPSIMQLKPRLSQGHTRRLLRNSSKPRSRRISHSRHLHTQLRPIHHTLPMQTKPRNTNTQTYNNRHQQTQAPRRQEKATSPRGTDRTRWIAPQWATPGRHRAQSPGSRYASGMKGRRRCHGHARRPIH